jgi:hypothetical protein
MLEAFLAAGVAASALTVAIRTISRGMGNEILAVIEKDSLRMGCLHLRGKVYSAVAAGRVGDVISVALNRSVGWFIVASAVLLIT